MAWALILGASSDIARATARRLAAEGYDLYLASRDSLSLEGDVGDLFVRYGIRAVAVEFDALEYAGHRKFYASLTERPEVVFCAVGYMGAQEVAEKDFAEAWRIMETNYLGCVSILNVVAEDFERRRSGSIVCVSSAAGERGRKSNYIYGSAKAGLTQYLSGLRNRLAESGVHVMTVIPGFVDTRMTEAMDLPKALLASPRQVAEDIIRGWKKQKNILYTRWFWRYIMLVIKHIPESIFKKLNL